ncbi:unnamed protein product [Rotaria socialis]|uniref:Nuclear receptor domain-containing protein n=1 Tax=Rotaria socialis TaxID=392032 RepID=A0A821HSZ8_9BILA|nr:unnamed protein product [Rotaria socialis]CAF4690404.1 unnamed protein product [Rotaria socialis]
MSIKSRELGLCLVCNDVAVGINFGIPTCMPCKAFFRRNAVKLGTTDFVCQEDGDCPITCDSRRMCNCCRLAKCFRVGMQKSLILSDAEKLARRELIQKNRQKRAELMKTQNSSLILVSDLCALGHRQPTYLSSSDQTLLTNIFSTYELIYEKKTRCQYELFPSLAHTSVHSFFNEYEERHKILIDYFKNIPEFSNLIVDDKIRLIRNHFGIMITINELMLSRTMHDNLSASLKNIFGIHLATNTIRGSERILSYIHDPVLLKLVLIILTLSSSINKYRDDTDIDRIFDNSLAIFAGQNIYVELLWRYLVSRLSTEQNTVKFFNKLVLDLLFIQLACFNVERYMSNLQDEVDQMKPLMQSMWPKSKKLDELDYDEDMCMKNNP